MKSTLKNKKGFTLVELLAVIVILALIMSIAVVSMSGIMQSARRSTFKDTALMIIDGVRNQVMLSGEANQLSTGDVPFATTVGQTYFFTSDIIESGGKTSPLGGDILYIPTPTVVSNVLTATITKPASGSGTTAPVKSIGVGVYRTATPLATDACTSTSMSFVRVRYDSTEKNNIYSICLTAGNGNYYIKEATQAQLNDTANDTMITNS